MIYLDHNATTPISPEVLEAMMPYLTSEWGNPSSSYKFGSKLKTVIETARAQVAELIGADPTEILCSALKLGLFPPEKATPPASLSADLFFRYRYQKSIQTS